MSKTKNYADDHALLEVLGQLVGVPLGRCYYMSTAVLRVAVAEWVEALRSHPEFGQEVERVLTDEKYRYDLYHAARHSNPQARRHAEQYAVEQQMQQEDREGRRQAQADLLVSQAVADGKAILLETARERRRSSKNRATP